MGLKFIYTNSLGETIEFSNRTKIYIESVSGLSTNSVDLSESQSYDQVGSTLTGSVVSAKDISIDGFFKKDNSIRNAILAVIRPDLMGALRYVYEEAGVDVFWEGKPSKTPIIDWNSDTQCFQFTFRAFYPYARKTEEKRASFNDSYAYFSYPKTFLSTEPFVCSYYKFNNSIAVENSGTTETGFTLTVDPSVETLASIQLQNLTTNKTLTIQRTDGSPLCNSNYRVVINTTPNSIYCRAALKTAESAFINLMPYTSVYSDFFQLQTGKNVLKISCMTYDSSAGWTYLTSGVAVDLAYHEVLVGV